MSKFAYECVGENGIYIVFFDQELTKEQVKKQLEKYDAVIRRTAYDCYGELGYVPSSVLVSHGWRFECSDRFIQE
jgi:hypothetical protein